MPTSTVWVKCKAGDEVWRHFCSAADAERWYGQNNPGIKPKLNSSSISKLLNTSGNLAETVSKNSMNTWSVSHEKPADAADAEPIKVPSTKRPAQKKKPAEKNRKKHKGTVGEAQGSPAPAPHAIEQTSQEGVDDAPMEDANPPAAAPAAPVPPEPAPGGNAHERAEEDESDSGAAEDGKMKVTLETPKINIKTFELMWAWIRQAIEKSHEMKSVPKGTFFEEVCKAILEEIYSNAMSVRIDGAASSGTQGDNGRDIVVSYRGGALATLPNRIFDCKNFTGKNKATRPHVRSVIGSMMTYKPIAKHWRGVGVLLTTTDFTEPAKVCAREFNAIQKNETGLAVELWDLNTLREELRLKFPDDEDESVSNAEEETSMASRLLSRIVKNLTEAKLAEFS